MASFSDDDPPAVILSESEGDDDLGGDSVNRAEASVAGSMGPSTSESDKTASKQFSDEELKRIAEIFKFMKTVEPKLSTKDKQWLKAFATVPDDENDNHDADGESDGEAVTEERETSPRPAVRSEDAKHSKKPAVSDEQAPRYAWDWKRTEGVLNRCLKSGTKGVLPTTVKGQASAKLTDVFDSQIAVQWVRRMEQLRASVDPLPMRGPFNGKLPLFKKLQENPLRMTALPLGCDLKLSGDEKPRAEMKPFRLGTMCPELLSEHASDAWNTRSAYLKQFEVISLQLERLSAIQTMVVTDLLTAFKQKENAGSPEVRAVMAEINPRLQDLRCLNDFLLNRTELLAYSTYKASKCIYLEALGYPKEEWGQLINRKWGAAELFDIKDSLTVKQKLARMQPKKPAPLMGPPMTPMPYHESRGMQHPHPPPFYHEQPMMRQFQHSHAPQMMGGPHPPQIMGGPHPGPPPPPPPPPGPGHFYGQPHWGHSGPPMPIPRSFNGFGGPVRPQRRLYEPNASFHHRSGPPSQPARAGMGGATSREQQPSPKILRTKKPMGATASAQKEEPPKAVAPRKKLEDLDLDSIDSILQEVLDSSRQLQEKD